MGSTLCEHEDVTIDLFGICQTFAAARIERITGLSVFKQGMSCGVYATIIYYFTKAIMRNRFFFPIAQGPNVRGAA
jgi:hypothetical protein